MKKTLIFGMLLFLGLCGCAETPEKEVVLSKTSSLLSKELLYMKFLQGIPIAGAVGGIYDAVYMKRVTEYANLKYKRRFLQGKI